jgi:hypothetical protein
VFSFPPKSAHERPITQKSPPNLKYWLIFESEVAKYLWRLTIAYVDSDSFGDVSVFCSEGILFEGVFISPKISP